MKYIRKISLSALSLFILFFLFPSCASKQNSDEQKDYSTSGNPFYGDTIVSGSIGDASTLIPILASDSASHEIASYIYNGLLKYDKDLKLVPELAESFSVSKDGLLIEFTLKKGIKWEDGTEFTSEDVLYTVKTLKDPATPTPYAGDYEKIENIEAPDKYTVKVRYKEVFAPALSSWTVAILPSHLLKGKEITKSSLNRKPVGTGPYILQEWTTGEKIVLKANPSYFEGKPYINKIVYRIIPDQATMFLELKSENIDFSGLTPLQYFRQTESPFFKRNFKKYRYPASAFTYIGYNLRKPFFADKRLRQALSYAIDKKEILSGVLLGAGQIANGPFKPGTWAYNSDLKPYLYNPEKAKQILSELGWKDSDGDGILDKDGRKFEFTLLTNQGNDARAKTAEIVQKRLAAVGISVKIRVVEWASFIKEFINKRRFDAVLLGWTISPDPDPYDIWHSSKTKPQEFNFISYSNPEVDELLLKGRKTFDIEERKRLYHRLQEILAEDQPYTFLYVPDALPVIHARFKGIQPATAGIFHNFTKWYVPESQIKYTE